MNDGVLIYFFFWNPIKIPEKNHQPPNYLWDKNPIPLYFQIHMIVYFDSF